MRRVRHCRRPGCERPAVATLTSVYADSTIVLGPLATEAQPEAYDLCQVHVDSFTAPRGWQVIRLATDFAPAPQAPLPFAATLVASRDDPFCSFARAQALAADWGAPLWDIGKAGHINAAAGHGDWPEGLARLQALLG